MTLLAIEWSLLQQTRQWHCSNRCSEDCQCFWMARTTPANCPFPLGSAAPHLLHGSLDPSDCSPKPASWIDRFSRFCMDPNAMLCIVNTEENPQNCSFPLGFRHPTAGGPSHGHRQNAQNVAKIALVVREISSRTDRQTDTHTQTCSLQYFTTASAGEVTRNIYWRMVVYSVLKSRNSSYCANGHWRGYYIRRGCKRVLARIAFNISRVRRTHVMLSCGRKKPMTRAVHWRGKLTCPPRSHFIDNIHHLSSASTVMSCLQSPQPRLAAMRRSDSDMLSVNSAGLWR